MMLRVCGHKICEQNPAGRNYSGESQYESDKQPAFGALSPQKPAVISVAPYLSVRYRIYHE